MANVLPVQHQQAILNLAKQGWSIRRIARELGIHRKTVKSYFPPSPADPKCTTNSTPGFTPKCTISTPGKPGRKSSCLPHHDWILSQAEAGLSAQRIYQDLRSEFQFQGSYQAVKRFVGSLKVAEPDRVWRIEVQPAEEAQVDFGLDAPLIDAEGKRRRSWVFRIVLSYSRRHFGGVPKTLNLDNLKAAGQLLAQIGTRYDTMEEALRAMARVQVNASRLTEYLTDVFKPSDPTDEGALVRTERNRDWAEHFFEEGKGNRPPGVRGPL